MSFLQFSHSVGSAFRTLNRDNYIISFLRASSSVDSPSQIAFAIRIRACAEQAFADVGLFAHINLLVQQINILHSAMEEFSDRNVHFVGAGGFRTLEEVVLGSTDSFFDSNHSILRLVWHIRFETGSVYENQYLNLWFVICRR